MEYGVQRRTIALLPPEAEDLPWLFSRFDEPEIYDNFGFLRPSSARVARAYRGGDLVVGIIHRLEPEKRIGFVILFPPAGGLDFWEFGYAIPDVADRDGFSALNAADAMGHYAFDHLRLPRVGWRTRVDNRAAQAVVRRLGYQPGERSTVDGHEYVFYVLDAETWAARRAKLERGEASRPSRAGSRAGSGAGGAFQIRQRA